MYAPTPAQITVIAQNIRASVAVIIAVTLADFGPNIPSARQCLRMNTSGLLSEVHCETSGLQPVRAVPAGTGDQQAMRRRPSRAKEARPRADAAPRLRLRSASDGRSGRRRRSRGASSGTPKPLQRSLIRFQKE